MYFYVKKKNDMRDRLSLFIDKKRMPIREL